MRPCIGRLLLALALTPLSAAHADMAFADVPPCHWAAEAVADVAGFGIFIGFPAEDAYSSVNAVRQVFEGLRCDDPGWSLRFLTDAPVGFGLRPRVTLHGFELAATLTERSETQAVVAFSLTVVLEEAGAQSIAERQASVMVTRSPEGWRVPYGELAALDLPIFP